MNDQTISKIQRALRTVEIIAMVVAVVSFIWMVVTMAGLENPVGNPKLIRAIMVTVFALSTWFILMVMREVKQFGWLQALVSVVFLIAGQVIVYSVLKLFK